VRVGLAGFVAINFEAPGERFQLPLDGPDVSIDASLGELPFQLRSRNSSPLGNSPKQLQANLQSF
jgi:hypothetical protein